MIKLWAVEGHCGNDSYIICCYDSKEMAEEHVRRAKKEEEVHNRKCYRAKLSRLIDSPTSDEFPRNSYDSIEELAISASHFSVVEISLFRHIDEFIEVKSDTTRVWYLS